MSVLNIDIIDSSIKFSMHNVYTVRILFYHGTLLLSLQIFVILIITSKDIMMMREEYTQSESVFCNHHNIYRLVYGRDRFWINFTLAAICAVDVCTHFIRIYH